MDSGATRTHITIVNAADSEDKSKHELTADQIAAGKVTYSNVKPTTTYIATLYNNDVKRGQLQFTTPAAMPSANYKYTLPSDVKIISQTLIEEIAEQAKVAAGSETNYSATIGIPAGATVSLYGTAESDGGKTNVTIPEGMSVTFFGLAGGDAPTINLDKNFDVAGSHAYIKFQNVKLVEKTVPVTSSTRAKLVPLVSLPWKIVKFQMPKHLSSVYKVRKLSLSAS